MILISILLAMATERYWHPLSSYRIFLPLLSWRDILLNRSERMTWLDGTAGVLLTVSPAVLVIALLQYWLAGNSGLLMWLLTLLFSMIVLVACIGDQRFGAHVRQYIKAVSDGDIAAAAVYLNSISSLAICSDNLRQLNRCFVAMLLIRLNERVLALLFWFVVLGPMGAVLYRSVSQLHGSTLVGAGVDESGASDGPVDAVAADNFRAAARRLKGIMDWVPARLTALCYAMIGSFPDAIRGWRNLPPAEGYDWVAGNESLLQDMGIGALQLQSAYVENGNDLDAELACEHVRAVHSLTKRTLLVWVTILALMTLAGWLG